MNQRSTQWYENEIVNYFRFVNFKKTQKVLLSAVGKMYIVCGILRNVMTSLYGNFTSVFFDIDWLYSKLNGIMNRCGNRQIIKSATYQIVYLRSANKLFKVLTFVL